MTLDRALMDLSLIAYGAGAVASHVQLFGDEPRARRVALWAVPIGALLHFGAIGAWCVAHRGESLLQDAGMPYSLFAFFLALAQVIVNVRPAWSVLASLTIPLAFIAQFYAGIAGRSMDGPSLAGGTPYLRPHVLVLLFGFAALALAFSLAVLYLAQSRLLKRKQIRGFMERIPPLASVGQAGHWMAIIGFSLLTLGILTGVLAAPTVWGEQWYLHPAALRSVIPTAVAWVIYAAYLGCSLGLGWQGRRTTYFLIAGFLVVVIAFIASLAFPKATPSRAPQAGRSNSHHTRERGPSTWGTRTLSAIV